MEHNELKPCPFCGGEAEKTLIGNAFTKSRSVIIKCTKCFVEQKTGTIYHNHVWLEEIATANWNKRVDSKPVEIPEISDEEIEKQITECGLSKVPEGQQFWEGAKWYRNELKKRLK